MFISVLLVVSMIVQLAATGVALWLMRVTRRRLAWAMFCVAMMLMAIRRGMTFYKLHFESPPTVPLLEVEWVALGISLLLAMGLILLAPLFYGFRRSEDRMRESELRFRQLCEAAFEGVVIHSGGVVVDANPRFAEMFGYTVEELIGKSAMDFISHDTKGVVLSRIKDGSDDPIEYEAVRRDGSAFPVEARSRSATFAGRTVRVTVVRDISERLRAESALRESRRRLATLMSNLPGMAYRCRNDRHWTMEFASEGCLDLTGYPADDLVDNRTLSFSELIHPDDRDRIWDDVQAALKDRQPFRLKYRIKTARGDEKWLWEQGRGLFDAAGNVFALEGFLTDISDQQRAEQELRGAQLRLKHLVAKSPAVIYGCGGSPDFPTTFISDNVLAQLGYDPQDFYGDAYFWLKRIHPEDADRIKASLDQIGDRDSVVYEYRFRHRAGHYVWLHDEVAALRDEHGRLSGLIGSWFDVSAQRAAEEALRKAHDELEERVRRRTAELTEANAHLTEQIAERARVEDALRESESRFRLLSASAPIGIFLTDARAHCVYVNEYLLRLSGLRQEDVLGQGWYRLIHPDDHQTVMEDLARTRHLQVPFTREFRLRRPDGEVRWVHTQIAVMPSPSGEEPGRVGTVQDITDRKRAEEALQRQSSELQRLKEDQDVLLNNTRDFLYYHDANGVFTYVSPSAPQVTGYTPEEWKTHYTAYLTANPINDKVIAYTEETLRSGRESPPYLVEIRHKDGHPVMLEVAERPYWEEGRIGGIIGVARDVTDRVRAETAHRESEQRLQGILDNTTAVVYLKDLVGHYLLVNRRFEELFHLSRSDLISKTDYDIFPKEMADAFRTNDLEVIRSCSSIEFEEIAPHDDGPHTYISLKFPLFDQYGIPYAVCGMSADITERKHAARELQRAKEAAEAANRAKSTFLANLSHEIRTPIAAMLGAAEVLVPARNDARRLAENVSMILRNGRHLLALIDDLLNVSRMEAGQLGVQVRKCSLPEILADVQAVTRPLREASHVEFDMVCGTLMPSEIETDPTRLKEAIINLINNALKFAKQGRVRVTIRVDRDGPEPRLSIDVEDTGPGIPSESLESIFETFTQIGPEAGDVSRGVGLGLPLARSFARQLGGDVTVESEVGKGSKFMLRAAVGDLTGVEWVNGELTGLLSPEIESDGLRQALRLSGRILVADDFQDMRVLVQQALGTRGADVVTVNDGAEAVERVSRESFDLILMDIRMPVMDGLTATREIRRRGCLAPIIGLTASCNEGERENMLEAGFDDVWFKPITLSSLIAQVASYLPSAMQPTAKPPVDSNDPHGSTWDQKLEEIRRSFASRLPSRFHDLSKAVQHNDADAVHAILHQLLGAAGIHGFDAISEEAARLHDLAKKGNSIALAGQMDRLKSLVEAAANAAELDSAHPAGS